MPLAVISGGGVPDTRAMLDQLQFEQFKHDETYHREITRLPTQQRLRHMTLHFAKYAGVLVEAQARSDDAEIERLLTDVFIIGLSTANALNVKASIIVDQEPSPAEGDTLSEFATCLTIRAGRMAAACEKLDHLEEFPFRATIRSAALDLVWAVIQFTEGRGWDLEEMVRRRLKPIKEKFLYHGQV